MTPDNSGYLWHDLINNTHSVIRSGFTDDILDTGIVQIQPLDTYNDKIYFVKEGYQLEGILEGIDENSNPVLVFVKLKE